MKLDVQAFSHIVDALRADQAIYFPDRPVRDVLLEQTIPREYSQLGRLRIEFADGGADRAFVKLYRHPRPPHNQKYPSAKLEHDAHKTLHAVFDDVDDCTVVRPIAVFPELGGWVMDEVDGQTFDAALRVGAHRFARRDRHDELARYAALSGKWLGHLQRKTCSGDARPDTAEILDEITSTLDRYRPFDAHGQQRVVAHAEAVLQRIAETPLPVVAQHGEMFTPHHVFLSGGKVVVFDITGIKHGTPYEDLSSFWVSLEALGKYPLFRARDVERLQEAFLEGFRAYAEMSEAALAAFQLKNMVRMLGGLIRVSGRSAMLRLRTRAGIRFGRRWILDRAGA